MCHMSQFRPFAIAVATALLTITAQAGMIELTPVGNPGNAPDAGGYGDVDYAYHIGKYEVTAGQYTQFLNAVARTDTYGLYNANMWSSQYGCQIQQIGSPDNYAYSVAAVFADRRSTTLDSGTRHALRTGFTTASRPERRVPERPRTAPTSTSTTNRRSLGSRTRCSLFPPRTSGTKQPTTTPTRATTITQRLATSAQATC